MDCSAFTQILYRDVFNINLERSARLQYTQGSVVSKDDTLKFGDLVFFNTRKRVKPGHVGIYIGDNLFAHASTKKGVTITELDYDYYARNFMGARRFESNGLTEKTQ
jgi:lipoprotein Spr